MVQTEKERKAKQKAINARPENKAKRKAYAQSDKGKDMSRKYTERPEVKARQKARQSRPENIKKEKARRATPENKAKEKIYFKEYFQRPEVKKRDKARYQTPEIKSKKKDIRNILRLKVLQYYSKHLSNSDIPCCVCCGLNSHLDFLAIDHVAGKTQMDSEPELLKLGYSSKFQSNQLLNWIVDNNFPKGFQVLCTGCNFAKGMKKNNNKCPMEGKPH